MKGELRILQPDEIQVTLHMSRRELFGILGEIGFYMDHTQFYNMSVTSPLETFTNILQDGMKK